MQVYQTALQSGPETGTTDRRERPAWELLHRSGVRSQAIKLIFVLGALFLVLARETVAAAGRVLSTVAPARQELPRRPVVTLTGPIAWVNREGHTFRIEPPTPQNPLPASGKAPATPSARPTLPPLVQVVWDRSTRVKCEPHACPEILGSVARPVATAAPGAVAVAPSATPRLVTADALRPGLIARVRGRLDGRGRLQAIEVTLVAAAPPPPARPAAVRIGPPPPSPRPVRAPSAEQPRTVPFRWLAILAAFLVMALALRRRGATSRRSPEAPVPTPKALADTIRGLQPESPTAPAGLPLDTAAVSVLLVDDEPDIRLIVQTVLRSHRFEVHTASSGAEALERVESWTPDVIVTDVMMPRMDGWALVKRLRANPRFALVPVIFLSTMDQQHNRMRGFRLGADDYVGKTEFTELPARIEAALARRARLESALRSQSAPAEAPTAEGAPARRRGLSGSLEQLGLPTLLTSLEMERRTGVLVLRPADGSAPTQIRIRDGRIVSARLEIPGGPRCAEAIYRALEWGEGEFEFAPAAVDEEEEMHVPVVELLMEGARLQDERQRSTGPV